MIHSTRRVIGLALSAIATMLIIFYPFLLPFGDSEFKDLVGLRAVFSRVFPFNRGLFEDKVANFWCISSIVVCI